jgi:hypothetical protein
MQPNTVGFQLQVEIELLTQHPSGFSVTTYVMREKSVMAAMISPDKTHVVKVFENQQIAASTRGVVDAGLALRRSRSPDLATTGCAGSGREPDACTVSLTAHAAWKQEACRVKVHRTARPMRRSAAGTVRAHKKRST